MGSLIRRYTAELSTQYSVTLNIACDPSWGGKGRNILAILGGGGGILLKVIFGGKLPHSWREKILLEVIFGGKIPHFGGKFELWEIEKVFSYYLQDQLDDSTPTERIELHVVGERSIPHPFIYATKVH